MEIPAASAAPPWPVESRALYALDPLTSYHLPPADEQRPGSVVLPQADTLVVKLRFPTQG